ncbi:MAG TPA: tRNA isopentenyl-2-thiomethyl-A-37 hydroxylase MiaE [Polyangiaceae bacterium]|jgi:tRNA-(ms[2]io[6]A)-hydroxylase|nr:tRNA isopentenyl-2-thiomethyl-A-37 hydroxylase MiaE [Polyangiaceae bacterium]
MLCLTEPTSARWVEAALADLDAVLVDHAHCEMKAASNALSLAVRASQAPQVVSHLVSLAEEELSHFRRVLGELERRGLALGPPPLDAYAAELRKIVRAERKGTPSGTGLASTAALVDRLLVAALIEARSCERFRLLADALRERGPADLHALYQELLAAEARHFRTFVDLAHEVARPDDAWIDGRLAIVARLEGELASRLGGRPAIHG